MPSKVVKSKAVKSNSDTFEVYLGTFIDNAFTWYSVAKYKDLKSAYKGFKNYVNTQLKYTDEELQRVWDTGRLDIELRQGNKLLNWVGIYSRKVASLDKKEEKEVEKGKIKKESDKDEKKDSTKKKKKDSAIEDADPKGESFDIFYKIGFEEHTEHYKSKEEADERYDELIKLQEKPSMSGLAVEKRYPDSIPSIDIEKLKSAEFEIDRGSEFNASEIMNNKQLFNLFQKLTDELYRGDYEFEEGVGQFYVFGVTEDGKLGMTLWYDKDEPEKIVITSGELIEDDYFEFPDPEKEDPYEEF